MDIKYDGPDHCSEDGARKLADRIKSYWLVRGYAEIRTQVVKVKPPKPHLPGTKSAFAVISNINEFGFPPRKP